MRLDINRKQVQKNAWRITKTRGKTALRLRVPGGHLNASHLDLIKMISEKYGNGTIHITTRQGFEIPGIPFEKRAEINALLEPYIRKIELETANIDLPSVKEGYPSAGTRNISACIGNRVCPFANYDTTALAYKIEKTVYPNDFHVKIAATGCPNDCIKAHMQDIGILGQTLPEYDYQMCIGCEACAKNCKKRVTDALSMSQGKVVKDDKLCIGCGECILVCPVAAWTRSEKKYFEIVIMGRTGKKRPQLAMPFIKWATEEVLLALLKNLYKYIGDNIDRTLVKEHVGYIVDRTGFAEFKKAVLMGISLNPEAIVASEITWPGYSKADSIKI
ncbi:MAG: sulfite reductase subunit C [Fibrobacteres bacterium]|nr:sulfite reductase subunit C [Fibrobacterota bacterium]